MRKLLILILVATLGWSVYWIVGSEGSRTAFQGWFDQRRADGWVADYSDLTVQGFPNRFDATFSDLSLADPNTGLAWDAPFFQLLALSYQPNHIIAIWPNDQRIATPLGKYDLTSTELRASAVFQPDTQLALERTILTAASLVITPQGTDAPISTETLSLAAERVPATNATYHLGFAAGGFSPSASWTKIIDPGGTLPQSLSALSADLTVSFDKPWNRSAVETARPQPREINIKLAEARWGQLELQLAGDLTVDAAGHPNGQITIKARNWREILQLAVAAGALRAEFAGPLTDALGLIAQLAGNPKTLDIPLDFSSGRMYLGPVPIGSAPVLVIR